MGPHRDSRNTGEGSYVMHWGQPIGEGSLATEHGDRYEKQRVWHDCGDLAQITHWVEPLSSGRNGGPEALVAWGGVGGVSGFAPR